jgi:flagellar basal-body rod protein FlgB
MSFHLEPLTLGSMATAMTAAARRHEAIAANIANAQTVDYVPVDAGFAAQLAEALDGLRDSLGGSTRTTTPASFEAEPLLGADGQPAAVHLDEQVAAMARNSVHYQALAQGVSRQLAILAAAAADGRK